jgi:hypothetical protein
MSIPRIAWLYIFLGLVGLLLPVIWLLLDWLLDPDIDYLIVRHRGKEERWRKWQNVRTVEKK